MTGNALDQDGDDPDEHPPVVVATTDDGVELVDQVERHRYGIGTSPVESLRPVDADRVLFPVDAAVALTTDHLAFRDVPALYVRDEAGEMLASTDPPTEVSFGPGAYHLEVGGPLKVYVRCEGPFAVEATTEEKRVRLDGETNVLLGGRSKHQRPAGSVTTTERPVDVMAAISTFGSTLKTTSPERSFPTLRGHPPTVELGDRLSIPDGLAPPDTGVTIEVPRDYEHVLPVASLAHYLGARVEPGDVPRLVTDRGFVHDLAPEGAFEHEVERVLKTTFLLDCVTRTEGLYDVDLHERHAVERAVDRDLAALYDRPLAERLAAYLEVPYDVLAPQVPDWALTTHVATDPTAVETLPFLVDDLAVIRTAPDADAVAPTEPHREADAERAAHAAAVDSFLRTTEDADVATPVVPSPDAGADAMATAWVGDGVPRGASKAVPEAYRNGLDRSPAAGDIDITVVSNDAGMVGEHSIVRTVYGDAADLPFDVSLETELRTDELRGVLEEPTSFLHYVGHIDTDGFECVDGTLDAGTLASTGVESFLLNACSSYEQGMALIEAGAAGGIVTLADVVDDSAVEVGATVARLLNRGYPLRPALEIGRTVSYVGDDYVVVGDGTLAVAQAKERGLLRYRVERADDGYAIDIVSYASTTGGIGTMTIPHVGDNEQYYLCPGLLDTFHVDEDTLVEFLGLNDKPVLIDRSLYWSSELDAETVESQLGD